jgi:hypothetical protein
MATLQDAIAYVQTLVGGVSGIRAAPEYPTEDINIFPFAMAYSGGGTWEISAGRAKGLHTIVIEIHVARQDLPRDTHALMAFSDSIPQALLSDPTLGGNIATFGTIRYTFGQLGWAGIQTLGFRFYIDNVKMEAAL